MGASGGVPALGRLGPWWRPIAFSPRRPSVQIAAYRTRPKSRGSDAETQREHEREGVRRCGCGCDLDIMGVDQRVLLLVRFCAWRTSRCVRKLPIGQGQADGTFKLRSAGSGYNVGSVASIEARLRLRGTSEARWRQSVSRDRRAKLVYVLYVHNRAGSISTEMVPRPPAVTDIMASSAAITPAWPWPQPTHLSSYLVRDAQMPLYVLTNLRAVTIFRRVAAS